MLGEAELTTVGYVASQYGRLSGNQPERLTHTEEPWLAAEARRKIGNSDKIESSWIPRHFVAEAAAADDEDVDALDSTVLSRPRLPVPRPPATTGAPTTSTP